MRALECAHEIILCISDRSVHIRSSCAHQILTQSAGKSADYVTLRLLYSIADLRWVTLPWVTPSIDLILAFSSDPF